MDGALGTRHYHRELVLADATSMQGWQDFRRWNHVADGVPHVHSHSHSIFERHHHDSADATVVALGGDAGLTGDEGGLGLEALGLLGMFAGSELSLPAPIASDAFWPRRGAVAFKSCDLDRLDRPPQA